MKVKQILLVCASVAFGMLTGLLPAADWTFVPASYTDSKNVTWDTISDGNWKLCVTTSGTSLTTKGEGNPEAVPPFAVEGTGDLDLSKPIWSQDGLTAYQIVGIRQSAFWKFAKAFHTDTLRGITSFVAPKEMTWQASVGFCNASDLVSATYDAPQLTYIDNRTFEKATALKEVNLRIPDAKWLGYQFLSGMGNVTNRVTDWRFDSLTNLQPRVFGSMGNVTGNFYFPSVAHVAHQAFINDKKIRGLLFGSENPEGTGLVHVGKDTSGMPDSVAATEQTGVIDKAYGSGADVNKISVAYAANLDFLVIGKGTDQLIDDYAFSGVTGITNIFFCGDMPMFGTTVFRHLPEKSAAIYIPKGNATYAAAITSVTTPTAAEEADFAANHAPGELIGMVNTSTYFSGNSNRKQYLAYGNYRQFLNDVVTTGRPSWLTKAQDAALYWACERTLRELPADEAVTIRAPGPVMKDGVKYAVTGYTLETATLTGWSPPVTQTGDAYVRPAGTKGTVRVTWQWAAVGAACTVSVSTADPDWAGDTVALTCADGSPVPAIVDYGTLLKATPTCPAYANFPKVRFNGWSGLKDGDVVAADGTVTFAFDGTLRNLTVSFVHDWVYDASAGTVWNRRYRLNVTALEGGELGVGTSDAMSGTTAAYGNAFVMTDGEGSPLAVPEAGKGLDLRGNVTDVSGEGVFVYTKIGYRSLGPWAKIADDARVSTYYPTSVTTPGTLTALVGYVFSAAAWDYYPMTNLVVSESTLTTVGTGIASGHRNLYRLVLDCPKLKGLPKDVVNASTTCLKGTNLAEWNLPEVETVAVQAFGNNCKYPDVKGTLVLPNVTTLGEKALSPLSGAESFVLGTNGFVLASIGNKVFFDCAKLKRLVLGARGTVALGSYVGPTNSVLTEIDFPGKLPKNLSDVLDALLSMKDVSEGAAKYVTVTGSRGCGLDKRVSWDAEMTADELANKPEGDVFGVYTTGEGIRKAYLVGRPSAWDPKGMMLIIR